MTRSSRWAWLSRRRTARPAGVTPVEAERRRRQGAVLLDVREPAEWRTGHAPSARHIPLGELAARVDELPTGREVLAVCRSGRRSAQAAALLSGSGRHAVNVTGGMAAWAAAGLPVITAGGRPGRIA